MTRTVLSRCREACHLVALLLPLLARADYEEELLASLDRCDRIDEDAYQTGLWLNPDGYRSYYKRSACLQRTAVEFRKAAICKKVKRRLALLSSSWGYSTENCEKLVSERVAADREALLSIRRDYLASPVTIVGLTLVRNGNGRDYDFIPVFRGAYAAGYVLEIHAYDEAGSDHLIYSYAGYVSGAETNLRLFLRKSDLSARFPGFASQDPFRAEARLRLSVGQRTLSGWLSESFIEQVFPRRERTTRFNTEITFR